MDRSPASQKKEKGRGERSSPHRVASRGFSIPLPLRNDSIEALKKEKGKPPLIPPGGIHDVGILHIHVRKERGKRAASACSQLSGGSAFDQCWRTSTRMGKGRRKRGGSCECLFHVPATARKRATTSFQFGAFLFDRWKKEGREGKERRNGGRF